MSKRKTEVDHSIKKTMSTRLGSCLPIIFVKGKPAKLHQMSLEQLRRFLKYLVKCQTKEEMPLAEDAAAKVPPWWPSDFPFSQTILYQKGSPRELIRKLIKIVSRCYQFHHSSNLIAVSSSLAGGSTSSNQSFGKLSLVELEDGTTRILNGKDQLVVVVRTATRYYDQDETQRTQALKRRRSARLVSQTPAMPVSSSSKLDVSAQLCYNKKSKIEAQEINNRSPLVEGFVKVPRKDNDRIRTSNSTCTEKNLCLKNYSQLVIKAKKLRVENKLKKPTCRICGKSFDFFELLEIHEVRCQSLAKEEDVVNNKENFLKQLGLFDPAKPVAVAEEPSPVLPEASKKVQKPEKKHVRNLRKVFSRSKIGAVIKAHPLPITSLRGQQILNRFGERKALDSGEYKVPEYEQFCKSRVVRAPKVEDAPISTLKKHRLKENQYAHSYSFSKFDRKARDVELVLGLSTTSFKLLNRCRQFAVKVPRIPKATFDMYFSKLKQREEAKKRLILEIIKSTLPIISLVDVVKYPNVVQKFRKCIFKS